MTSKDVVGIILSGATTREATCQLLKEAEKGKIKEGMLLITNSERGKYFVEFLRFCPSQERNRVSTKTR